MVIISTICFIKRQIVSSFQTAVGLSELFGINSIALFFLSRVASCYCVCDVNSTLIIPNYSSLPNAPHFQALGPISSEKIILINIALRSSHSNENDICYWALFSEFGVKLCVKVRLSSSSYNIITRRSSSRWVMWRLINLSLKTVTSILQYFEESCWR